MAQPFRYYFIELVSAGGPSSVPNCAWRGSVRIGGVMAVDRFRAYESAAAVFPVRPWEMLKVLAARNEFQRQEVARLANEAAARHRKFGRLMDAICAGRPLTMEAER